MCIYLVVVGVGATGIYAPLRQGNDDMWVVAIGLAGAHVALGAGVGRIWALVPAVLAVGLTALAIEVTYLLFVVMWLAPVAALVTALGVFLSHAPYTTAITALAFLTALPGMAWALAETIDRADAPRVPAELEKRLPTDLHLANLCPGTLTPERLRSRLEAKAETLIREVQRHPGWLVPNTYYYEGADPETREITIRELAEEELGFYESAGPRCRGGHQARLRAALE